MHSSRETAVKPHAFAEDVFHLEAMREHLPESIVSHLKEVMTGSCKLEATFAEPIAEAMKNWAIEKGATYFCHWFYPLTGTSAQKQDAFFDGVNKSGHGIERFSAKQLMRGEPDASSFPHGGLRSTHQARGYTTWDTTAAPFVREGVLFIPAIFFSWTGQALDFKIPLMRSEAKIAAAASRLLSVFAIEAKQIFSTLGCEQEYFLVDREYYLLRPDLLLTGRTLCGQAPSKGQELEEFYLGSISSRVAAFMTDVERKAFALGIPLKTRHAEVAPGQYEFAPLFEKASLAIDHNLLLMELMQEVAQSHGLACLFHEKPFARVNGSGKHCNWSLSTDTGMNLLDPHESQLLFLTVLTAVLYAVHQHGALLRASIATQGNDHRLGGNEAPPAIISVYLGEALENWLSHIEEGTLHKDQEGHFLNLGVPPIPDILLDQTDRNRTSAFAFTGNKFEFRAVGSSAHCAVPITTLNVIVAQSLNTLIDEIEKELLQGKTLKEVILPVAGHYLHVSTPIRFSGDNYTTSWAREAKKRKLPIIEKSTHAFAEWLTPQSLKAFEGVLSHKELESRSEVLYERYSKILNVEALLLIDLFRTKILPAALQYQKVVAESVKGLMETGLSVPLPQSRLVKTLSSQISKAMHQVDLLEKQRQKAVKAPLAKGALMYCDLVAPQIQEARDLIDSLESMVDDTLWPLPKYQEMLHIL